MAIMEVVVSVMLISILSLIRMRVHPSPLTFIEKGSLIQHGANLMPMVDPIRIIREALISDGRNDEETV